MRKPVLYLLLTIFSIAALAAETPETIDPKTKTIKPQEWYATQAALWKAEIIANRRNDPSAWLNYYTAARYAQASAGEINTLVGEMKNAVPGSYEAFLVEGLNEGYTDNAFRLLKNAYTLAPEKHGAYGPLVLFNELATDNAQRAVFSEKLFSSAQISQSLLHYSYNVLMSLEEHAVLFTEGDNTTLPVFVLQDVMRVRPDVKILNLDQLVLPIYRDKKLAQLSLTFDGREITGDEQEQKKQLCTAIPQLNPATKFYYALTLSKENIVALRDQLYVVGLASQLSKERLNNISLIKENLENRFLLDYLTVDFNGESEYSSGKVLSSNYLVPVLLLHEHYMKNGEKEKSKEMETLAIRIASQSGKETLVNNFLKRDFPETIPFFPFPMNAKNIEGRFRPVKGNIHAAHHEVTNSEYNTFLQYLLQNKLDSELDKYEFNLTAYNEPALSFMKAYSAAITPTKKQKYFSNYPAVNISHESALAYCDWLTQQYNNTSERKYKKVRFRLPTLNEWQVAAAGIENATSWVLEENTAEVKLYEQGKEGGKVIEVRKVSLSDKTILYPWFKYFNMRGDAMNSRGCYLGNFKIPDNVKSCQPTKRITADGFFLMSPVQAYFPNDIGLYDVVGNVAEMIDEKGKACGGSWNHAPEESTIRSISEYKGPDAAVGFRIFMEIIEP